MCKIKQIPLAALLLIVSVSFVKSEIGQRFSVDRKGRPIQVDALLIEWKEEDTDTLEGDFLFTTDAMNTPSGIAGYIRFQYRDACPLQELRFFQKTASGSVMSVPFDTADVRSPYYSVEKSGLSDDTSTTVEWLIPWDKVAVGSDGMYEIICAGLNAHCDTIRQFMLSGKHENIQTPPTTIVNPRIIFQVLIIALMFIIFAVLKAKAAKMKKQ